MTVLLLPCVTVDQWEKKSILTVQRMNLKMTAQNAQSGVARHYSGSSHYHLQ